MSRVVDFDGVPPGVLVERPAGERFLPPSTAHRRLARVPATVPALRNKCRNGG